MLLFDRSTRALKRQCQLLLKSQGVLCKASPQIRFLASRPFFRPRSRIKKHEHFLKSGTWLASDPSNVQPLDVLKQLPNLGHYPASSLHTAVILATPSFTHWLDRDNDFLEKLVHQLFFDYASGPPNESSITFRTMSAIVDRIPSDTKLTMRAQASSVGNEGISILLSGKALRSLEAKHVALGERSQNAHLLFVSQIGNQEQLVGLQVANTTFRNGRDFTSFEDVWELGHELKNGSRFQRMSRVPLKSFNVPITPPSSSPFVGVPMVPLTRPQEIVSSIGNVIKDLKRSDTGQTFPASTDLEAAVPKFLKLPWLTDVAKTTFAVFALITRKDFYAGASEAVAAGIHPPARRFLLPCLFDGRARLHRVTGGGGGWGNKKGLLSLEPGINIFDDKQGELPALPPQGEDYGFRRASALASPGDNIQFFASFSGPQSPAEDQSKLEDGEKVGYLEKEAAVVEAWRSEFPRVIMGTNPPEEQYPTTKRETPQSVGKLMFVPDCFGMLSEGGICLGRTSGPDDSTPGDDAVSFTSRLDIRYTTLIAVAKHPSLHTHVRRIVLQPGDK